uniref:TRAF3-interacting protein 1 C-terminal domain-containing protein n=2 Tax=Guillardia theta TaxID=55529 RepID=A0A6U5WCA9_GUITH|mmetsp:Transcript_12970/g.45600  ORF Transcript_12970/g.45600 Transcript_12970/m.45600 type:complete len:169 (+) Transcript_12970:1232-1738(+)
MLVRNMLAVEADIAGDSAVKSESVSIAEHEKLNDKKRTQEEMNKLREAIQALCQSTNPLARSMDYLQEDLDNMTKEMEFWMKDKEKQTILLDEEEKKSEVELEKLYSQLQVCLSCLAPGDPNVTCYGTQSIEESIQEETLRITDMKAQVMRNDMTIKNMLVSVVRPSR